TQACADLDARHLDPARRLVLPGGWPDDRVVLDAGGEGAEPGRDPLSVASSRQDRARVRASALLEAPARPALALRAFPESLAKTLTLARRRRSPLHWSESFQRRARDSLAQGEPAYAQDARFSL